MPAEFWADYTHRVSVVGGFTASGNGPWWAICSVAKAELQTATGWGLDWTTKDGGEVLEASEVIGVPTSCPRLAHSSPRPRAPPWLRDSIWSSFVQPDPSLSTPAKCICSPDTKQKKKNTGRHVARIQAHLGGDVAVRRLHHILRALPAEVGEGGSLRWLMSCAKGPRG